MGEPTRAIGLFSGGLDSILSVKILQEQDIEVIGYTFATPFFGPEDALKAKEYLGIRLEILEITDIYMKILKRPKYGYGKNLNPCIDCHALMFRLAGERLAVEGARFLFSGEVLGERPFSQNTNALRAVANLSGYPDYILRPLSAKLLPETLAERAGWVDRSALLDIQGRSRKRQMELADRFNVLNYPKPAGGCRLTEPNFTKRLKDLLQYTPEPSVKDLELLKLGRHLRWDDHTKLIIGRREEENHKLEALWNPGDLHLWVQDVPGPAVIIPAPPALTSEALLFAAQITVRYSDVPRGQTAAVAYTNGSDKKIINAAACEEEKIKKYLL